MNYRVTHNGRGLIYAERAVLYRARGSLELMIHTYWLPVALRTTHTWNSTPIWT